ncbi:MAG: arabinogalactan endo-1,4-beta-galactosidase [Bacteroidia bacterium]|nr:arabinogalactan endo-1,4-beta-galactosidase [Bacteroidia bacterium]
MNWILSLLARIPIVLLIAITLFLFSCDRNEVPVDQPPSPPVDTTSQQVEFIKGADLSYVNEMLDCGAVYKNGSGLEKDPYEIFSLAGCQWVRLRLWHNPDWTSYSNFTDVKKAIKKSRDQGMKVLLDFHYSDDWADPSKQFVPKAWEGVVNNNTHLGDSIYNYTYKTLKVLENEGLLPEMLQLGNEINIEMLQDPTKTYEKINWSRNSFIINKSIEAVEQVREESGESLEIALHIAQPENALWWFSEAKTAGIEDFEWIAISYYPAWSSYELNDISEAIMDLKESYKKEVMIVETAYPFTLENQDAANNILGLDALLDEYPASIEGQLAYLKDLEEEVIKGGGAGLFYWEPAWVSTSCSTRWGEGSHWDNAVFFDSNGEAHKAMEFFK